MGAQVNARSVFNASDEPSPNARIAMFFDQGTIEHSVHGSVRISGKIPLLLPHGLYVEPPILKNKERLENTIKKVALEFRCLWEKESDASVERRARDLVLYAAYVNPMDDLSTPFLTLIALAFAIEDILKETSGQGLTYAEMTQKLSFFENLFDGGSRSGSEATKIESLSTKFLKQCEESIPNFWENCEEMKQEWKNTLSSYALLGCRKPSGDEFSDTSKNFFGSSVSASNPILEFTALLRNLTISEEIRDDILFQRMKVVFGSVSNLMKDVFGIGQEVKVNKSTILTQVVEDGQPLQVAFEDVLEQLCAEINDVKLTAQKVRETYWDDEDLKDYVECLERALDGQFYLCQQLPCHQNLNFKIVSL